MYTVPSTASGFSEQPSSITVTAVGDAVGVLASAAVTEALMAARLDEALLARWASTPVAAASPITAADSRAMMHDRMKTRRLQPNIVRGAVGLDCGGAVSGWACELKGEATVWLPYVEGGAGGSSLAGGVVVAGS